MCLGIWKLYLKCGAFSYQIITNPCCHYFLVMDGNKYEPPLYCYSIAPNTAPNMVINFP